MNQRGLNPAVRTCGGNDSANHLRAFIRKALVGADSMHLFLCIKNRLISLWVYDKKFKLFMNNFPDR